MAGIFDEVKKVFQQNDNALNQLILINIIVFAVLVVLRVFSTLFGLTGIFDLVYSQFSIPPNFTDFLSKPWTIITYSFAHSLSDIFHILFNLLFIYWFGRLIIEYLGSQKVVNLYILGAIAGGVLYLIFYNLIPFFKDRVETVSGMVGASAAVYSIMVAAATLLPNYSIHLIFIGPVKIKYIAAFYIFISFMGSVGANAGGNIAHLGGALIGFLYIKQIQNGVDIGKPIQAFLEFFRGLFNPSKKIKVSYKAPKKPPGQSSGSTSSSSFNPTQKEIDDILDKIADKGYESLSKIEKEKLFNFGKEKN